MKYRSIFISDLHLGTKGAAVDHLQKFLKDNSSDNLYLIGDIIDIWALQCKWYWPQSHSNIIRQILSRAKHGVNVKYIIGNHDELLRNGLPFGLEFGDIQFSNEVEHIGVNGQKWLITHGDLFDSIMEHKFISHVGDRIYTFLLSANTILNKIRNRMGFGYWSFSKWAKANTKTVINFIYKFEDKVAAHAKQNNYSGVFCGHIHSPATKDINGVTYMNCGDWCETCSAIVERYDGVFELQILKSDGSMEIVSTYDPSSRIVGTLCNMPEELANEFRKTAEAYLGGDN
jgi:UDP-2,3-diacylglucosamine pyrophosphatase LpxH